jgi:hypothetical protein
VLAKELSKLEKEKLVEKIAEFFFDYWQERAYQPTVSLDVSLSEEGSLFDESVS